ncbi:hypothetical protein LZ318_08190 [Saccharopolyspora indica]|uniref:hypothetical protein n=1 Tax=Saccharopolyspora indica TaxID=1229659 RepID=UPI0022EB90AE|nr:hypothetical protein [Saccharopolyspora indica]MDA3649615.1 hypothetical protein [Saccharopolyspora indica]
MTRTTPPRPLDVASAFPELRPLARRAVRLHPRRGRPTRSESSVGGPLLWPVDEDWPVCTATHGGWDKPVSLEDVRRRRALLEQAWLRPRPPGQNLLSAEEAALLASLEEGHTRHAGPNALLPVAQLYLRDVPGLTGPEGADVLQVLWCPLDHVETSMPAAHLVWRASADVVDPLDVPPEPADVDRDGSYVPEPCAVHPEVVTEHPSPLELPAGLADRLHEWSSTANSHYQHELSVAPGWKVGGWAPWSFCDPQPMRCTACDAELEPLLTISSGEWDGGSGSWVPVEDRTPHAGPMGLREPSNPPMVLIGRGYSMQIYRCPESSDHPVLENMQ